MTTANWKNDKLQFARMLSEIQAVKLTSGQYMDLSESMDLSFDEIDQLLQRATDAFELHMEEPASKAVSLEWVLNQLAGMTFSEPGQAYEFIKKSFEAGEQ